MPIFLIIQLIFVPIKRILTQVLKSEIRMIFSFKLLLIP